MLAFNSLIRSLKRLPSGNNSRRILHTCSFSLGREKTFNHGIKLSNRFNINHRRALSDANSNVDSNVSSSTVINAINDANDTNVATSTVNATTASSSTDATDVSATKEDTHDSLKEKVVKLSEEEKLDDAIKLVLNELKNEEAWNQLIIECANKGRSKMSTRLLDEMRKLSMLPNQETYIAVLRSISSYPQSVSRATLIINQIIQSSQTRPEIRLEIEHVNYLLAACQRSNNLNVALETYDNLIRSGKLKPNKETYLKILNICSTNCLRQPETTYELATDIWNKLVKHDDDQKKGENDAVVIDNELVNRVISVFKISKHPQHAFDIIDSVYGIGQTSATKEEVSPPSETTTNSAATKSALILPITNDVLDSIFDLCLKTRRLNLGIEYYSQIVTKYPDFSPNIDNYNNLLTIYNFTYQFKKSLDVYHDQLKKSDLVQNVTTFETLMVACQYLRDLKTAKEVLENAIENQLVLQAHGVTRLLRLTLEQARTTENYDNVCWFLEKIDKAGDIDFNEEEKKKKGMILIKDMDNTPFLRSVSSAYEIALDEVKDLPEEKRIQWVEDKKFFDHKIDKLFQRTSKHMQSSSDSSSMHQDDLRIKKMFEGRWKTQDDEDWYNPDKKRQFSINPASRLNRRRTNFPTTSNKPFVDRSLLQPQSQQPQQPQSPPPSMPPPYRKSYYGRGGFSPYVDRRPPMYYNPTRDFGRPPPPTQPQSFSPQPFSPLPPPPPRQSYGNIRGQYNRRRLGGYRPRPPHNYYYENVGYPGPTYSNG